MATSDSWLAELPKVELHVHLEGSMSVDTVRALTDRHQTDTTGVWPNGLPEAFSFQDFPDFGRQYLYGLSLLRSGEDIATIVDDLAETLAAQNVRYAELTTTAYSHFLETGGRPATSHVDYREGLNEGRRRAGERGVDIGWVIDIPRDLEPGDSTVTVDFVLGPNAPDGLVGIGLGGYEVGFPAQNWASQFQAARAAGLASVPHAGETEGADSVRTAVEELGAVRLGHGVRCLEDPDLVKALADRQLMLEICPTSNLLIGVISDLEEHPLPRLVQQGLNVCINTDDPGWFDTDLTTELEIAGDLLDLDRAGHTDLQRRALEASFAGDDVRKAVAAELDAHLEKD